MAGARRDEALSLPAALGVLLGGPYALAVVAIGLQAMAEGSFPLAFGMDQRGDTGYPFPNPAAFWLGLALVVAGTALAVALVQGARGHGVARMVAVAALLVAMAGSWSWASAGRRTCAVRTYSGQVHCTSRTTAMVRDGTILAVPAGVAALCLVLDGRRGRQRSPSKAS